MNQGSCQGKGGWDLTVGESSSGNMHGRRCCRDPEYLGGV